MTTYTKLLIIICVALLLVGVALVAFALGALWALQPAPIAPLILPT